MDYRLVLAALFGLVIGWLLGKILESRRLRRERRDAKQQIASCLEARDAAAREVRRVKSKLVEAEAARTELASQLESSNAVLTRRDRTIETLVAEINDAKLDRDPLTRVDPASAEALEAELAASRQRVVELEAERAMLTQTEIDVTAELAHASSTIASLHEQLAQAANEKHKLDATAQRRRDRRQGGELDDELNSKQAQIDVLDQELRVQRHALAELRAELAQARHRLASYRQRQHSR